jgi:hypothetical protein
VHQISNRIHVTLLEGLHEALEGIAVFQLGRVRSLLSDHFKREPLEGHNPSHRKPVYSLEKVRHIPKRIIIARLVVLLVKSIYSMLLGYRAGLKKDSGI